MDIPRRPLRAERNVRNHLASALALIHLLALLPAARGGAWAPWAQPWAVSALGVTVFLLARDFLSPRRKDRLPDVPACLAWMAAFALELHAIHPAVAASRTVPAALFPGIAFLLPPVRAAAYAGISAAWLLWLHGRFASPFDAAAGIVALAFAGTLAGWAVRRRLASAGAGGYPLARAVEDGSTLVLSREGTPAGGRERRDDHGRAGARGSDGASSPDEDVELRRRGEELLEGIRRILEGLLPVCGADRIHYVMHRTVQGSALRVGASVYRGERPAEEALLISDAYLPVRDALVFRRAFFADGRETETRGIASAANDAPPTGVAAVPVIVEGETEGALLALRYAEGPWADPVVPNLETAAFLAAKEIALERRMFENDRALRKREGLHRLVRKIAEAAEKEADADASDSVSPRQDVYRAAVDEVRDELDADRVLLVESDAKGTVGRLACVAGDGVPAGADDDVPLGSTYVEWVMKKGIHRMFSSVRSSPGRHPIVPPAWSDPDEDAFLLVPVSGAGGFRGVLVCASRGARSFESRDADVVHDVLRVMRMGISHAYRLESLSREATSDGLTGLLNHRTFKTRLANNLSRLDGRHPCAVVLLDIDHFKKVNDTHGHPAGDDVLRTVAAVIGKAVRKGDFAGRYGGEEFVIFFHMTDPAQAKQAAERLRLMIRETKILLGGKEVVVTASLGVSCSPAHGVNADDLLKRADEALYRSKQGGRDRTTVCDTGGL